MKAKAFSSAAFCKGKGFEQKAHTDYAAVPHKKRIAVASVHLIIPLLAHLPGHKIFSIRFFPFANRRRGKGNTAQKKAADAKRLSRRNETWYDDKKARRKKSPGGKGAPPN